MAAPVVARNPVAAARRPAGRSGRPEGLCRFCPSVPEIVSVALDRVESNLPELGTASWYSRVEEETFVRVELQRRLELCDHGAGLQEPDLAMYGPRFSAMVRRGAPLHSVQQLLRAMTVNTFSELWARAAAGDVARLLRFSQWSLQHANAVERLLARTFADAEADRQQADPLTERAERLLSGRPDDGTPIGSGFLVVVLAGTEPAAAHRPPAGTLCATVDGHRHLLVPVEESSARTERRRTWTVMADWVAGEPGVRGVGVFATGPDRVAPAASSARRLVGIASAVGLPATLLGRRELAIEMALPEDSHSLRQVAAVLRPLDVDARLRETLIVFFTSDLDRTRTAAALMLSRSGLTLRLDRITRLAGIDPRTTRGIQLLGAALSARALLESAQAKDSR